MDLGHLWVWINKNKANLKTIDLFSDKIKYAHIHSNFGKEANHLPLTTGNLPLKEMIKKLKNTKIEWYKLEFFSTPEEIIKSRNILNSVL